jgi:glucose/arabinose dehydrogenase/mono/diheme cytochrome c family protein
LPLLYKQTNYIMIVKPLRVLIPFAFLCAIVANLHASLELKKGDRISLVGAGMGSRMVHYGHFETELQVRFPSLNLTIRNLCDEGNTPGFRPHPGREQQAQYAFPGAKELINKKLQASSGPKGHFETPDQWLTRLETDVVIAFFGFNSSFDGKRELGRFKKELDAFLKHTLALKYNGQTAPRLGLVSPTALQPMAGVTSGSRQNANLILYVEAMRQVAKQNKVLFVDAFSPSNNWYADGKTHTVDGALLNDLGYRKLSGFLADSLFEKAKPASNRRTAVHKAVMDKNYFWLNDYKVPNGVHVYGRRYNPFGPKNYPYELKKTREYTEIRDRAIWAATKGQKFDVAKEDAKTSKLPAVQTNYLPNNKNGKNGYLDYVPGPEAEEKIQVAKGYKIELFADEDRFPDLANPVQMAFDNKGRLWVSTMASYPHYRIGDPLPKDKLIIFEDTDNDGKADKQINFADDLHIPIGFEISHDGVYVSQSGSLIRLRDTDGDDRYDEREVMLSGFDDHDTHHAISAFCADPSGAFVMCEGVFLHSNVESAFGPQRGTNGGFYRYSPQKKTILRYSQFSIPNPWGLAFDDYGQDLFLHTSGTSFSWMLPGMVKARYGANMKAPSILKSNQVRPTSGVEFVSSRHFPDEVQGDVLINNNIGFLGIKQHRMIDEDPGFTTQYRQDLLVSKDLNFRPTDLEFAPDGSLYVVDWQNALIGHMQHSARDPNRDHEHGRIYRVTYPSRPLVKPAEIDGASIPKLLENLKLPEYRSRYRTRRELRGRDSDEVVKATLQWVSELPKGADQRLKLEALWVTWGAQKTDFGLLGELLESPDHRIRAAAVRVLRFNMDRNPFFRNSKKMLLDAANDSHGRVRMEAVVAASFANQKNGLEILTAAQSKKVHKQYKTTYEYAKGVLENAPAPPEAGKGKITPPKHLSKNDAKLFVQGAEIFNREAHCVTCHQENGKGLPDSGLPPLVQSAWVTGDPDRLIKLTLKGLMGPIEVNGRKYPGQVPMTPFENLLKDDEIASVLTYTRNAFGNKASAIQQNDVARVRKEVKSFIGLYKPEDLLKEHPIK